MDNRIVQAVGVCGFQKVQSFDYGAELYQKTERTGVRLVLAVEETRRTQVTDSWLSSMRRYLDMTYSRRNFSEINLLILLSTPRIESWKSRISLLTPIWFLDQNTNRIMIFEGQPASFDKLREALARTIIHDQRVSGYGGTSARRGGFGSPAARTSSWKNRLLYRGYVNVTMIVICIVVYLVLELFGDTTNAYYMLQHGAMYPARVLYQHEYWTLFTSMFLHFGFSHLFNNMLVLFFLGDNLERAVGRWKFAVIYIGSGLAGNLLSLGVSLSKPASEYAVSAGASGAIFGVMGALLYVLIRNRGRLEDLRTGNIAILVGFSLFHGFTSTGVDNMAHLGGLIGGFLLAVILYHGKKQTVNQNRGGWQ